MLSAREAVVVVILAVTALAMVAVAVAVDSAVPLFFSWVPQLGIIAFLSRNRLRRTSQEPPPDASSHGA